VSCCDKITTATARCATPTSAIQPEPIGGDSNIVRRNLVRGSGDDAFRVDKKHDHRSGGRRYRRRGEHRPRQRDRAQCMNIACA
jgi:hypothetical protein